MTGLDVVRSCLMVAAFGWIAWKGRHNVGPNIRLLLGKEPAQPAFSPDTTRTAPEGVSGVPGAGTGHVGGPGSPGSGSGAQEGRNEGVSPLAAYRAGSGTAVRTLQELATSPVFERVGGRRALEIAADAIAKAARKQEWGFSQRTASDLTDALTTERRTNEALREALAREEHRHEMARHLNGFRKRHVERLRSTLSAVMAERDEIMDDAESRLRLLLRLGFRQAGDIRCLRSTLAALTAEWRVVMAERDGAVADARAARMETVAVLGQQQGEHA